MIRRSRPGSALAHAAREPGPTLSLQEPCQQRSWAVGGRPRDAPGSSLNKDRDALPRHEYARMAGHMGMFEAKDQVYGFIGSSPAAGLDPRSEPVSMT